MANASYKLAIEPLIDTIFVFEIGGQYVDIEKLEGDLNDVFLNDAGIRIRVELGGIVMQKWTLEVIVDDNGSILKTVPEQIHGMIGNGGGSWFDRTCPLS